MPSELMGKWYAKTVPTTVIFEFTSSKFLYFGQTYDVSVSDKTVSIKGAMTGSFSYSLSDDEMTVTEDAGIVASLSIYNPLIKK